MTAFDNSWQMLLKNEGVYSNNPKDPGGETMYGITKRVAVANGYTGDMKNLPLELAKEIGKREYWDVCDCDRFPEIIAFQLFDTAYNGGHPIQWLQECVGVTVDGKIGPFTIQAVLAENPYKVVMRFVAYRIKYLKDLGSWPTFSRGWSDRMANNLLRAAQ